MSDEPEAAAAVPTSGIASAAGTASQVIEGIERFLPFITTIIGAIPQTAVAAPFLAGAGPLLSVLDNAAKEIAANNPGAAGEVILTELTNHLTKGAPNSPALS